MTTTSKDLESIRARHAHDDAERCPNGLTRAWFNQANADRAALLSLLEPGADFQNGMRHAFKIAAKELRLSASHGGNGSQIERAWAEQFENHTGTDHHPTFEPGYHEKPHEDTAHHVSNPGSERRGECGTGVGPASLPQVAPSKATATSGETVPRVIHEQIVKAQRVFLSNANARVRELEAEIESTSKAMAVGREDLQELFRRGGYARGPQAENLINAILSRLGQSEEATVTLSELERFINDKTKHGIWNYRTLAEDLLERFTVLKKLQAEA